MKKLFKIISKIISYAIFFFLLIIIALLLVYVVDVKLKEKDGKLSTIPYNFYIILTQSMYPNIKAGDMIITYKQNNYKVGDVITFVSESQSSYGVTITHRIMDINVINGEKYYTTKGDNNNTADGTRVSYSSVLGKAIFRIPKIGFIQQFIATKFGWLLIIVVPSLAIIIYDVLKLAKKASKKAKEKIQNKNIIEGETDEKDNPI